MSGHVFRFSIAREYRERCFGTALDAGLIFGQRCEARERFRRRVVVTYDEVFGYRHREFHVYESSGGSFHILAVDDGGGATVADSIPSKRNG